MEEHAASPDSPRGKARSPRDAPTDPEDYAALNAAFVSALAGVVALTRVQARRGTAPPPLRELPLLSLATFALANVLAKEKLLTWLREPFVEEGQDHRPVRPEGEGLRYAIGELLMCTRCVGAWSALGLTAIRTVSPSAGRTVSTVLAAAGANDVLQAGFRLLVERANRAAAEARAAANG